MRKTTFLAIVLSQMISAQSLTLVKDINPGASASSPSNFAVLDNKIFFTANDGVVGAELWTTDGTSSGTNLVQDFYNIGNNSSFPQNTISFDGKLYFNVTSLIEGQVNPKSGLLATYDQNNGIKLINNNQYSGTLFTKVNNRLYFKRGFNGTTTENTLYYVESGNAPVSVTGSNTILSNSMAVMDNVIYLGAASPTSANINDLYKFDGTNFTLVKKINTLTNGNPIVNNLFYSPSLNKVFFSATNGNTNNGVELWMTDGTEAGTVMVKDINTSFAGASSSPTAFMDYGGKVYFFANNGINGNEMWVTDGTEAGTTLFKDINPNANGSSSGFQQQVFKNKMYFFASDGTASVTKLFESDGTVDGTKALSSLATASTLIGVDETLYIGGRLSSTDTISNELYKIDLSDITLAVDVANKTNISVYPNPTSGSVFVKNVDKGTFALYDVSGKLIKTGNVVKGSEIHLNETSGIYHLKINTIDNKQKLLKVIVK
jgi:ELWxxDGT repeat protein